ncbi:MAG TPA: K(+)-transporting ATPase subunit F [Candidatus Dormibacteraeota bacterium]|nr:K(+)-transporting ATPase subunit F [Candidatus Dormibacteraeota bacterium]
MDLADIVLLIVSTATFIYLVYAMIRPERF